MAAPIDEQERDAPETRLGFFTVVSARRLPLAAALMAAVAEHRPLARRHVIVTDAIPPVVPPPLAGVDEGFLP